MYRDVRNYKTIDDYDPCEEWINGLQDRKTRGIIRKRIERLRRANYNNYKPLNADLHELKIPYGPGYRVYFGIAENSDTVILLCCGTKHTQKWDIPNAQEYADTYIKFP